MSIEAMTWAANLPLDVVNDSGARHVLLMLANHARNDGRAAFPSVATLMRTTGMARRTVQGKLRDLREAGVIKYGNQGIAQALGLPADRTPTVYDLCMFDEIKPQHVVERGANSAPRADDDISGRKSCTPGAQITTQRGADSAPEPSRTITPSLSEGACANQDSDEHPIFKLGSDDDDALRVSSTAPATTGQRFSMHRDWEPKAEHLDAELIRRGLPPGTTYEPGWLADFTAHYADKPGMQKSESGWLAQFAKWIQQNQRQQHERQQITGGHRHEQRRTGSIADYDPAAARARDRAKNAGMGAIIDGTATCRE